MAGYTLKEVTCVLNGWLHIEGRDRFSGWHIEGRTCVVNGWLHIEGTGTFTRWLAPY